MGNRPAARTSRAVPDGGFSIAQVAHALNTTTAHAIGPPRRK